MAKLAVAEIGVVVEEAEEEVGSTRTTLLADPSIKAAHILLRLHLHKGPVLKAFSPAHNLCYTLTHIVSLFLFL